MPPHRWRLWAPVLLTAVLGADAQTSSHPDASLSVGRGDDRAAIERRGREDPTPATITIPLGDRDATVQIVRVPEGLRLIVLDPPGDGRVLTPEQFVELAYREQ